MESRLPYNLSRFLEAQAYDYDQAVSELKSGKKESHWIWYIFPQIFRLGSSSMAIDYAIKHRREAVAYLAHPILGHRILHTANILYNLETNDIQSVMGTPDDLKLKSSMTLFSEISDSGNIFRAVLNKYYDGAADTKTIEYLNQHP